MNRKHLMAFGVAGAAFTALCCFTPVLVGLLGLIGVGAVTGYLDYVLLSTLAGFLALALHGLSRRIGKTYLAVALPIPQKKNRANQKDD